MGKLRLYKVKVLKNKVDYVIVLSKTNLPISGVLLSEYSSYYRIGHNSGFWSNNSNDHHELKNGEYVTLVSKGRNGSIFKNGNSVIINNKHYNYSTLITKDKIIKIYNSDITMGYIGYFEPKKRIEFIDYRGNRYKRINKISFVNK